MNRTIYRDTLHTRNGVTGEVIEETRCDATTGLPVGDIRQDIERVLAEANYVPAPKPEPVPEATETPITLKSWDVDRNTDFMRNKLVKFQFRGFYGITTHEDVKTLHTSIRERALTLLADDAGVKRLRSIRPQIAEGRREAARLIAAVRAAKDAVVACEQEAGPDLGRRLVELSAARDALQERSASLAAELRVLESAESNAMTSVRASAERALQTARVEAARAQKEKEKEAISRIEAAIQLHAPALIASDTLARKSMEGSALLRTTDMIDDLLANNSTVVE